MTDVTRGQIWKDNDPRKERLVYVLSNHGGGIRVHSCDGDGARSRGARDTDVDATKFIKRFTFVRTVDQP